MTGAITGRTGTGTGGTGDRTLGRSSSSDVEVLSFVIVSIEAARMRMIGERRGGSRPRPGGWTRSTGGRQGGEQVQAT